MVSLRDNLTRFQQLESEPKELLKENNIKWNHRSKKLWFKFGDCSTKYFCAQASQQCRKNAILLLVNDNECWKDTFEDFEEICMSCFVGLFASTSPSQENIDFEVRHLESRVTLAMSKSLDRLFTVIEVKNVLFQIHPKKSSSLDGFLPHFF